MPAVGSVRVFVTAPDRSEEIAVTPSLEDAAARAAVLPSERQLTRLARQVIERERRHDRPVETVRIETWRIAYAPGTLTATLQLVRDFSYRVDGTGASATSDDVGVADPVLQLTAIILLLRPFDVWWVSAFTLAAACLSLVVRARQAVADHLVVAGDARHGPDRFRLAAVRQPHLPPGLLVPGDWTGARGPDVRGDAGREQPMAPGCGVRDGGPLESGVVA